MGEVFPRDPHDIYREFYGRVVCELEKGEIDRGEVGYSLLVFTLAENYLSDVRGVRCPKEHILDIIDLLRERGFPEDYIESFKLELGKSLDDVLEAEEER